MAFGLTPCSGAKEEECCAENFSARHSLQRRQGPWMARHPGRPRTLAEDAVWCELFSAQFPANRAQYREYCGFGRDSQNISSCRRVFWQDQPDSPHESEQRTTREVSGNGNSLIRDSLPNVGAPLGDCGMPAPHGNGRCHGQKGTLGCGRLVRLHGNSRSRERSPRLIYCRLHFSRGEICADNYIGVGECSSRTLLWTA